LGRSAGISEVRGRGGGSGRGCRRQRMSRVMVGRWPSLWVVGGQAVPDAVTALRRGWMRAGRGASPWEARCVYRTHEPVSRAVGRIGWGPGREGGRVQGLSCWVVWEADEVGSVAACVGQAGGAQGRKCWGAWGGGDWGRGGLRGGRERRRRAGGGRGGGDAKEGGVRRGGSRGESDWRRTAIGSEGVQAGERAVACAWRAAAVAKDLEGVLEEV